MPSLSRSLYISFSLALNYFPDLFILFFFIFCVILFFIIFTLCFIISSPYVFCSSSFLNLFLVLVEDDADSNDHILTSITRNA